MRKLQYLTDQNLHRIKSMLYKHINITYKINTCIQRHIHIHTHTHATGWSKHTTCTQKDYIFECKHKNKLTFEPFMKSKIKTQVISIDNVLSISALLVLKKPH